jgi:plasmid stability protein
MRTARVVDMSGARDNVLHMSKMIQIRNVPDELHRDLKRRAALAGMSMSDYIKQELDRKRRKSTIREIGARSKGRSAGSTLSTQKLVEIIRESRGD